MDKQAADSMIAESPSYTPEALMARAMRAMKPRSHKSCPRWVAVMDTFATGSTMAYALCVAHGYDPEEKITRR